MTLLESLVPLAILGLAIGGASTGYFDGIGALRGVAGALVGGLIVPVLMIAVVHAVSFVVSVFAGRPYWPACTACGAVDFRYEASPGPTIVRCACSQRYVRHGRQCRHALPGGASRPHLRWRPFRGWTHDADASPTAPADPPYRVDPS